MGNGASALTGHIYQHDYMAFRLLSSEAKRLLDDGVSGCVSSFVVEGPTTHTGPTWDICFTLEDGSVHLLECKNTAITRDDRKVFYRRARRQLASGTSSEQLTVGWVTDAGKQSTSILDHLRGAAKLAAGDVDVDLQDRPNQVNSPEDALREALYFLCGSDDSGNDLPAVSVSDARELLFRLAIEQYPHRDLVESVKLLATGVFSTGTGPAIRAYIVGKLSTKISEDGQAAYDREGFLAAIGTGSIALTATETFKDILSFHSAAMIQPKLPRINWEQLDGQPEKVWSLSERLPGWDSANSSLVVAQSGIGKTSTTWQAFEEQSRRLDPHHVLRFDAADLEPDNVRILPRLCCVLTGVGATWVAIDGLDEIDTDSRSAWRSTISTLARLPRVTLVIAVREEVLAAYDWLQQLVSGFRQVELLPLTPEQVRAAFREVGLPAPKLSSLLTCLQNTFLFSLYARMAKPNELPLETSGEVTGFQIIEQYWERRVLAESQGLRDAPERQSGAQKRRAIGYLVGQTLAGKTAISLRDADSDVSTGVDVLLREGVLHRHSTNSVRWAHDWLRQYAIIDRIIEDIADPSPRRLVTALTKLSDDTVQRAACVAEAKYVLAHDEWGPIEEFLNALFELHPEHCSEALPVLVEGSASRLRLQELAVPLIIEAIEIAIQIRAGQWADSVATLPRELFLGVDGARLFNAVVRYEVEVAANV